MDGAEHKLTTLVQYKPLLLSALLFAVIESAWCTWVYQQRIDGPNVVNAIQRLERSLILWKRLYEVSASHRNSMRPADIMDKYNGSGCSQPTSKTMTLH